MTAIEWCHKSIRTGRYGVGMNSIFKNLGRNYHNCDNFKKRHGKVGSVE
jgi:hypothetical protein